MVLLRSWRGQEGCVVVIVTAIRCCICISAVMTARAQLRAFEMQLADAARADAVQRQADLITANLYR